MNNNSNPLQIQCPHCGHLFSPEKAIEHSLREQLEKEADAKVADKLKTIQSREMDIREREKKVANEKENVELEVRSRLLAREDELRKQADERAEKRAAIALQEKARKLAEDRAAFDILLNSRVREREEFVREEERMSRAELEKKLHDQGKLVEEMERKMKQGSMQTQGEVQELAIADYLEVSFPHDEIHEVAKGKRGGDCVHQVKDRYGNSCGRILYESKRTRHFGNDWIPKLKEDMRLQQAEIGVIVTEIMPADMPRFGERDGVWICTFAEFKALAFLFRSQLARLGELTAAQHNRGEKEKLIYDYVTGREFRQKIEAAFEGFAEMQHDLAKERALFAAHWAKREKANLKSMENLVAVYGDVRGITGGAVQEIGALEMPEIIAMLDRE